LVFVLSTSANSEVNGFVAGSYFSSKQGIPYATQEVGVGVSKQLSEYVDVYASAYGSDNESYLSSAFVEVTIPFLDFMEWTVDIGRVRNCYCLYNYTRLQPATRDQIVLPQSMYWSGLDDFANYTDGVSVKSKISGLFSLSYTTGKFEIRNPDNAINYLMIPGIRAGKYDVNKVGLQYESKSVILGAQKIKWTPESSILGKQWAEVNSAFIKYINDSYSVSYEQLTMGTELGKTMNLPKAKGYSITATKFFDNYSVFVNQNYITYNSPILDLLYGEGKNTTTDKSIGVRYRLDKNITLKAEHHWVEGFSYNLPSVNNKPTDKYFAAQVIYSF
jgi:hypothetical protein